MSAPDKDQGPGAGSEGSEGSESWSAMLRQVPLWFWLALVAPVVVVVVLALTGK